MWLIGSLMKELMISTTTAQKQFKCNNELEIDGKTLLFTGDAGIALDMAADHVISSSLSFIQVPHHGSRRNIGPEVLNKLVGNIVAGSTRNIIAFISCARAQINIPINQLLMHSLGVVQK
jgi:hypothetical protein